MSINLNPIGNPEKVGGFNNNFTLIEEELNNNVLRRDGLSPGEANQMKVDIDMNGHSLLNVNTDLEDEGSLVSLGDADFRYVGKEGSTMSGVLDMGNNIVNNLPAPVQANDATRKSYVDQGLASKVDKSGDSMSGNLDMSGNDVSNIRTTTTDNLILGGLPVNAGPLQPNTVIYVDTIADLQALPTSELVDGQQVQVKEYHAGTGVGGGEFYWDAAGEEGDNGGTIFAVGDVTSGRWRRPVQHRLTPQMFGAPEGEGNDSANALNKMFSVTGTVRIDGDFHAYSSVLCENRLLDVEGSGSITFHGASNYFRAVNSDYVEVAGTDLTILPKKHDTQLAIPASVSEPSTYYAVLVSDEVEINRRGSASYAPYMKNECLDIINDSGVTRSPVRLDYATASDLTVRLYRKDRHVRWSGVGIKAASGYASTRTDLFYLSGFYGGVISPNADARSYEGVTNAVMRLTDSCGLLFEGGALQGESGPSNTYGILSSRCSHITYRNVSINYSDGSGRLAYSARHCSNIRFDSCGFISVDDHYGHNYTVENMTLDRVTIAGGSLTVRRCDTVKGNVGLVFLRGDTPYADGDLIIEDCHSWRSLVYVNLPVNITSVATPFKLWDRITIKDSTVDNIASESSSALFRMDSFDEAGLTVHKTQRLVLDNVQHTRHKPEVASGIFNQKLGFDWLNELFCDNVRLFDESGSDGGTSANRLIGFRWLLCESAEFYRCKHLSIHEVGVGSLSVIDTLSGHPAAPGDVVSGLHKSPEDIRFQGATITAGFTLIDDAHITANIVLQGCTLKAPLTWSSTNNTATAISALIGNIAEDGVDLAWAPDGIFNYVKAGVYKTSEA